jgi:hypothetical protein
LLRAVLVVEMAAPLVLAPITAATVAVAVETQAT